MASRIPLLELLLHGLLVGLLIGRLATQEGPWVGLKRGSYGVGFRVVDCEDADRSLGERKPRPIQISCWYPASGATVSVQFGDYVELCARELGQPALTDEQRDALFRKYQSEVPEFAGASSDAFARAMQFELGSGRDAPPAPGSFPLVLTIGSVDVLPRLCELLASHGFVVASVPPISRALPRRTAAARRAFYEDSVRDLLFASRAVSEYEFVDSSRSAFLGFGGGGMLALPAAVRSNSADAFVAIDSALFLPRYAGQMEQVDGFALENVTMPLLHVRPRATARREDAGRRERIASPEALFVELQLDSVQHHDLTSSGWLSTRVLGLRGEVRDDVHAAGVVTSTYVLHFLRAQLANDADSAAFLRRSAGEAGLPSCFALSRER